MNLSFVVYPRYTEFELAFWVYKTFKKSISSDCVVDIWLRILIQVDNLSIASTFEVENAVVIPAVLIITRSGDAYGSVESVVFPVPDRPKKIAVFLPSKSVFAEQCIEAIPLSGRK